MEVLVQFVPTHSTFEVGLLSSRIKLEPFPRVLKLVPLNCTQCHAQYTHTWTSSKYTVAVDEALRHK